MLLREAQTYETGPAHSINVDCHERDSSEDCTATEAPGEAIMGIAEGSHLFVVSIRVGHVVSTVTLLSESRAMRVCVGEPAVKPDCTSLVSLFITSHKPLATGSA